MPPFVFALMILPVSLGSVTGFRKPPLLSAAIFPVGEREKTCHSGLVFHYRASVNYCIAFSVFLFVCITHCSSFSAMMEPLYEWGNSSIRNCALELLSQKTHRNKKYQVQLNNKNPTAGPVVNSFQPASIIDAKDDLP